MGRKGTKSATSKKVCVVCGKEFMATMAAVCCGSTCRSRLARMRGTKRRPEYLLIAQSAGQKVPVMERVVKKEKPTEAAKTASPEVPVQKEELKLTERQKATKIHELEEKIKEIMGRSLPPGKLPKAWMMEREIMADEVRDELKEVEKIVPVKETKDGI